jgi:predicted DsbA family dithiol-disulfide isomerase
VALLGAGEGLDLRFDTSLAVNAVRADIDEARALGANGVPFFVIDQKYGISGAQPAEVFLRALQQAQAAAHRGGSAAAR